MRARIDRLASHRAKPARSAAEQALERAVGAGVFEDDFITRAVRSLSAMLARTTAAEVRAEADVERERADAALGRAREALASRDLVRALSELEQAIAKLTHLPGTTALRLDTSSLRSLAPIGGLSRLASLFEVRAEVLRAQGRLGEAERSDAIAHALR